MRVLAACSVWFVSSLVAPWVVCAWAQTQLAPDAVARFATADEGRAILGRQDDYFRQMSAFDRMLRLRTEKEVSDEDYRAVIVGNVTDWPLADRQAVASGLEALAARLKGLNLPLPPLVWIVRTTGVGELGNAHTQANAIVLPAASVGHAPGRLQSLLAHELFHLMTRHDARFRERAYRTIGFQMCEHVELPPSIAARRLTNPDALRNDAYIEVAVDGGSVRAVPVSLSRSERFDPQIGTGITDYWMMRLMVVEPADGARRMRPAMDNGMPVLLEASQVKGFFEQIGTNTSYIVHPEEILADHFALMATGAGGRQPQFIDSLRALLQEH
jgi:hypothetical protein